MRGPKKRLTPFGKMVVKALADRDMSRAELAATVGTSPQYMSYILNGTRSGEKYVYDMDGKKICEAVSAELLAFGPHCSQAALEKHLRDQKRNEREVREYLEERVRPYELRLEDGARPSDAVGMIDLTIKATPSQKLVSLPKDRMFRSEQASKTSRKKATDDTFLNAKGDKALSLLRAMNE